MSRHTIGMTLRALVADDEPLARTGLVQSRQDGRYVIYRANFQNMNELVGYLTENCCGRRACAPSTPRKGTAHETLSRARQR